MTTLDERLTRPELPLAAEAHLPAALPSEQAQRRDTPAQAITPRVVEGALFLRQWDGAGVSETARTFHSLGELYACCLEVAAPNVVDRIVIRGYDPGGQPRAVSFGFRSVTTVSA